ncbi:MAG: tetratricopeptide repeat protein [Opitutales bacterium]|nr:tetratricopeptide repeat protein [Opitutales bacterium]
MLMHIKKILVSAVAILLGSASYADLVWTPEKGWQVQGGVLANVIGEASTVSNAIEAMNEARSAQEDGSRRKALSYYNVVISEYPESIFAPEAYYQSAKLFLERGQFPNAYEYVEQIIKNYPDYPNFKKVISLEYNIASEMQAGKTYYVWGWFPWFTSYKDIIKYYESVVSNAPYSDYAPIALMNIAIISEEEKEYDAAFDALERVINTYPNSMFTSDAYLQMAKVYRKLVSGPEYDQDPTKNAISFFQDYTILFPKQSEVALAEEGLEKMQDVYARSRLVIGDFFYYYRNNGAAASIFYNETITIAPKSEAAEEARKQLQKIDRGELAPMTPYDWFFGRYEKPSIDQFEDETKTRNLENE